MTSEKGKTVKRRIRRRRLLESCGFVLIGLILTFSATPVGQAFWNQAFLQAGFRGPQGEASLRIHVLDVGKADAMLLECEGETALLDAGMVPSGDDVVDYLARMGISQLDYVIASHPDSDHIGGMAQVLQEVPVHRLVMYSWPEELCAGREFQNLRQAASSISTELVSPGDCIPLGGAELTVLGPLESYEDSNDCSLVLRLDYQGGSALFCGDIEYAAETDLVKSGADLQADLLKVPHHGSASSCSQRFLEAVSPEIAVISVGPDNNELPREETLLRLEATGAQVLRTDTDGTLVFSWENGKFSVWSEKHTTDQWERTE